MKRLILCAALALAAPGCANMTAPKAAASAAFIADAVGAPPPAVIASRTIVDEQAITLVAKAVDGMALSATAAIRLGVITPGSPKALQIASALDTARIGVNLAASARTADSYHSAKAMIETAIADFASAMGGN